MTRERGCGLWVKITLPYTLNSDSQWWTTLKGRGKEGKSHKPRLYSLILALLDHLSKPESQAREAILICVSCSIFRIIRRMVYCRRILFLENIPNELLITILHSPNLPSNLLLPVIPARVEPQSQTELLLPVLLLTCWPTQSQPLAFLEPPLPCF